MFLSQSNNAPITLFFHEAEKPPSLSSLYPKYWRIIANFADKEKRVGRGRKFGEKKTDGLGGRVGNRKKTWLSIPANARPYAIGALYT